jgi:hypothetical protein
MRNLLNTIFKPLASKAYGKLAAQQYGENNECLFWFEYQKLNYYLVKNLSMLAL